MKTPLALLLLAGGGIGLAQQDALPPGVAVYPGVKATEPERAPEVRELRLERTRCLTECPAYAVTFFADGSFRYTGHYGVERLGEHAGRVEVGTLRQVFRYLKEIRFFGLEPRYTSPYLDNATTVITAVGPAGRKTVTNYANSGPATLWALERLVELLLEGATWNPGGGPK